MQYLNDDIDELFRRAAEDYPLNTNNSDWEKVNNAIAGSQKNSLSKKSISKIKWLLPLLILSLWVTNTFIGYSVYNKGIEKKQPTNINYKNTATLHSRKTERINQNNNTHKFIYENQINLKSQNIHSNEFELTVKNGSNYKNDFQFPLKTTSNLLHETDNYTIINNINLEEEQNNLMIKSDKIENNKSVFLSPRILFPENNKIVSSTKTNEVISNRKHFYAGLIGGIDMSTVKLQNIQKAGLNTGLILGYHTNNKWSIEMGVLYDNKSYYTSGNYFKYDLYPNTKISNVNGICNMIELPVNLKYNFKNSPGNSFYILAGASSYLMKKEAYNYQFYYNGSMEKEKRTYLNSSNNFFSIINISAGYEKRLGKMGILRLDPYAKLPINGVGIGKLPITSFGVNIGFFKDIF